MSMAAAKIDYVQRVKEYLAAFERHDLAVIREEHLSETVVVEVDGKTVAEGRDEILPSYQKDFEAGKLVRVTVEPCLVADGVVQVGLESVERRSDKDPEKKTLLTVRYHYDDKGMQFRHAISDVRMIKSPAKSASAQND